MNHNQPIPVPPQHMPGGQRMMPQGQQGQQRPPSGYQQQGQLPLPQLQQPHQFQQQGRPAVINDIRFTADRPINGLAKIHSIVAPKETTEKDIRKHLTTYEAYAITPTVDEDAKKDKDSKKRSAFTKDKKSDSKKETWTKALIVQEVLSPDAIAKAIKKLDEREDVAKKLRELGQNQRTQVSNVLDEKILQDRDIQFAWEIAQLHRDLKKDSSGNNKTKCITLYLKRAPKPDVDPMEIMRRREMQKLQQQQNAEHNRHMQAMRQQDEINQMHQQAQQRQMPQQMGRGIGPGPMGPTQRMGPPPMAGRGRCGPPAGIRVVPSDSGSGSGSDSSSNSGSDSESDSEVSSATSQTVSTRPSRSGRHGGRGKQYYGRGTSRVRSRSRARNSHEKDYLVVNRRRLESRRDQSPRGVHYVPDSPRSPRATSRPGFGRSNTYNGRPTVEVHSPRQSRAEFFDMEQHSPRTGPRPIIHNQGRPEVISAPNNVEIIAAAVQAGMQAGQKAARDEKLTTEMGALTLQRPMAHYAEPRLPRPPMPHSSFSDFIDRRTQRDIDVAEAIQRQDEIMRVRAAMRDSRPALRDRSRDYDRSVPRRFAAAELYDQYSSTPMSPSISSGSSGFSHSSRGGRDPYGPREREYDHHRRRESSLIDSDREEYDFIGRDEANPFRPLHTARRTPSRPPPFRRSSFRSEAPYPRGY